jgi:hypothetical protein
MMWCSRVMRRCFRGHLRPNLLQPSGRPPAWRMMKLFGQRWSWQQMKSRHKRRYRRPRRVELAPQRCRQALAMLGLMSVGIASQCGEPYGVCFLTSKLASLNDVLQISSGGKFRGGSRWCPHQLICPSVPSIIGGSSGWLVVESDQQRLEAWCQCMPGGGGGCYFGASWCSSPMLCSMLINGYRIVSHMAKKFSILSYN